MIGRADVGQRAGLKPAPTCTLEITSDDLHDAYVFARLRKIGIGYAQAIESPDILAALRGTALARKAKQRELNIFDPVPGQKFLAEVEV